MIVDDRLDTVLRTVPAGPSGARVQFRQLADILAHVRPADWTERHRAALDRLESIHDTIGTEAGGALLRSVMLRSPALVDHFARLGGKAAIGAIGGAHLSEQEWLGLIPRLPVQARGALRHRRDLGPAVEALLARLGIEDFALPLPEPAIGSIAVADGVDAPLPAQSVSATQPKAQALVQAQAVDDEPAADGIRAIVRRIEAFRRSREELASLGADPSAHPRLPFANEPHEIAPRVAAIDIEVDAEGTIVAADARMAPMIVGHRPFTGESGAPAACDTTTLRMIRARLPVEAGLVTFEGAAPVAGTWRIDAVPTFAREGGPFTGYHARLRRTAGEAAAANDDSIDDLSSAQSDADDSSDRLRQLLHELRPPVNAIQGFAELIQQQLFGPTPHQYRSLAASIAADASRMLAGFEEVERVVKLESGHHDDDLGPGAGNEGADPAAIFQSLLARIEPVIARREIRLRMVCPPAPLRVAMAASELERTAWRLLTVIATGAAPGEKLALTLVPTNGTARIDITLPAALAMRDDDVLFASDSWRGSPFATTATLGSGFALRLAAAEVRAVGGALVREGAHLVVDLPLLTGAASPLSQDRDPVVGGA